VVDKVGVSPTRRWSRVGSSDAKFEAARWRQTVSPSPYNPVGDALGRRWKLQGLISLGGSTESFFGT
jgi:hypothetical protein